MRTCAICGGIGIHAPKDQTTEIEYVVAVPEGHAHPMCYCRKYGVSGLLSLDDAELEHIRLCDVDQKTLAAIMRRREWRGRK